MHNPTIKEFRPIAVTSTGSKLVWGITRDNMEQHMVDWDLTQVQEANWCGE